jgi:hypothetical protein
MPNEQPHAVDRPEAPAIATRAVLFAAAGFLVFVGISLIVLHIYYGDRINQAIFVPPTQFAKPQLQIDAAADLAKLQSEQRGRLNRYAWVDRDKGIAAIPIEEAMKRVVARGADAYSPIDSNASAKQPAGAGGGKSP